MANNTVVQVLDFVPNGKRSLDRFLIALTQNLKNRGWRTVFVFAGEPNPEFAQELHSLGSTYFVQSIEKDSAQAIKDLGIKLKEFSPKVLQTHFISKFARNLVVLYKASGAEKLIVTDRSSGAVKPKTGLKYLLAHLRTKMASRMIDEIICVSDFVRRRNINDLFFPANMVSYIYNGIDTNYYQPSPSTPNSVFTLTYAGQLIPEKGVDTVIKAVRMLIDHGINVTLNIAGKGHHDQALKNLSHELGLDKHIHFLGHIDYTMKLYSQSDVVVVPSSWEEAFGFVAAEAASCEACLVVSSAGALPEIVGADCSAGLIFEKDNPQSLHDLLIKLKDDVSLRDKLRKQARQRAISNFSLKSTFSAFDKV